MANRVRCKPFAIILSQTWLSTARRTGRTSKRMFKVANVIAGFNAESGGPPRTVARIAAAGSGQWHADLFTTDYVESKADSLLVNEFPGHVNVLPSMARSILGGLSMMAGISSHYRTQLLRGVRPDVVHIHGIWSPYLAAFALTAIRHQIPFIVAPHGMLEPWSMGVRATRKALAMRVYQRSILRKASALHATSKMEGDNLRRLGIGDVPVFVVPNSVALPPQARIESPSADGKRVLLFLSRIHEKKGLDMLLQAWNGVRPSNWRLLIVGSGEQKYVERLKSFCAAHGVPNVQFKSHVEGNARELMFQRASAFVLPTYSENFGNVVAEALIRGLPVITTTGTPWSELAEQRCGLYIEPTVSELKRAIGEVTTTDEGTLARMGGRGRDYATSHFTLPVVRERLLSMYRSAIDTRARN
jgi:glycosyltransferase involved in cell wall biosynthesis